MSGVMHVYLVFDDHVWYAQGLEIDYISQGNTPEEAIDAFLEGLKRTLQLSMSLHGNVDVMFKPASDDVWNEFTGLVKSGMFVVREAQVKSDLPYKNLVFMQAVR